MKREDLYNHDKDALTPEVLQRAIDNLLKENVDHTEPIFIPEHILRDLKEYGDEYGLTPEEAYAKLMAEYYKDCSRRVRKISIKISELNKDSHNKLSKILEELLNTFSHESHSETGSSYLDTHRKLWELEFFMRQFEEDE